MTSPLFWWFYWFFQYFQQQRSYVEDKEKIMPYRLIDHLTLFRKSQRLPTALSPDGIDNPRKSNKKSKEIINRQRE